MSDMANRSMDDSVYTYGGRKIPSKSPGTKIRVEDRRDRVMAMAVAGKSARGIAKVLGLSHVTISRDIKFRLKHAASSNPATERYRELHRQRIEILLEAWWSKATDATDRRNLEVLDRMTKLLERQAKLLGLDKDPGAPQDPDEKGTSIKVTYVMPKQIDPEAYAERVNVINALEDRAKALSALGDVASDDEDTVSEI